LNGKCLAMTVDHYLYIKDSIYSDRSKQNLDRLIIYVYPDSEREKAMVKLLDDDDKIITQRVSWMMGNYAQKYPGRLNPFLEIFCARLQWGVDNNEQALLRNMLKILEYHEIPIEQEGLIYDLCSKLILNLKADIAPRAFAITLALKVVIKYPELGPEFLEMLNIIKPDKSAAIQFRIRKARKAIKSKN